MKTERNSAFEITILIFMFSAILAVLTPILHPKANIFFIHFGFPFHPKIFGSDFRVHEYMARNILFTPEMYSVKNPFQGEPYGSPPFLPWFFKWTLLFDVAVTAKIWSGMVLAGVFGSVFAVSSWVSDFSGSIFERISLYRRTLFSATVILTYPVLFAFERGATDIIFLVLFTASFYCLLRSRFYFLVGCFSSAIVFFKVYPLPYAGTLFLLSAALIVSGFSRKGYSFRIRQGVKLLLGQAITAAVIFSMHPQLYWYYAAEVVRSIRQYVIPISISHSLTAWYPQTGYAIFIVLWGIFSASFVAAFLKLNMMISESVSRTEAGDSEWMPVGLTALCSIVYLTSFITPAAIDYSLILGLPLMIVLICSKPEEGFPWSAASLWLMVISYSFPRWIIPNMTIPYLKGSVYFNMEILSMGLLSVGLIIRIYRIFLKNSCDQKAVEC